MTLPAEQTQPAESVYGEINGSEQIVISSDAGTHPTETSDFEKSDESVVMDDNYEAVSGPRRSLSQRVTDEIRENLSRARSEDISGPEGFYEDPREADEFDFSDDESVAEYDPGVPVEDTAEYSSVAIGPMLIVIICVVFSLVIPVLVGGVIALGGWRMMQLKSFGWATIAAVLALLPCHPAWLLGLIFGIWSLIVLNRPHVKAAFGE